MFLHGHTQSGSFYRLGICSPPLCNCQNSTRHRNNKIGQGSAHEKNSHTILLRKCGDALLWPTQDSTKIKKQTNKHYRIPSNLYSIKRHRNTPWPLQVILNSLRKGARSHLESIELPMTQHIPEMVHIPTATAIPSLFQ